MTLLRRALPLFALAALAAASARAGMPLGRDAAADSRFDVRVVALVEATRLSKAHPDPDLNGTRKATVRWTGTWKNVRVRVTGSKSSALAISANATGSIRGVFEFADRRPAERCSGTHRISSPATLRVTASRTAGGPTSLTLTTAASKRPEPSFCPDDEAKLPSERLLTTVEGLKVRIADADQGVGVERVDRAGALFIPVEQLRNGLKFSITTDLRRTGRRNCGYRFCSKTVRAEVRLTFTPKSGG